MTEAQILEQLYPNIQWRRPVLIHRTDGVERYCCRICIATHGLSGLDLDHRGFETAWEAQQHIEQVHPEEPG